MNWHKHYKEPGLFVKKIMNPIALFAMRAGISIWGSRILEVRGRKSGITRRVPVNLLSVEGTKYLVSPRGESQWVRNIRADNGQIALLLGRDRSEWVAHELPDSEKSPILRAYLQKWKMEVGIFFYGVNADSQEADIQRITANHPVFRLSERKNQFEAKQSVAD